jgi:hypothetical protein
MPGTPAAQAALAIAAFSVGVEIGHQMVVLPAFAVRRLLHATAESLGID